MTTLSILENKSRFLGYCLNLYSGEVVAILGHNGAGKSTLIKMLAGAYEADSGDFIVDGEKAIIRNPRDARKYGIETIFQTLENKLLRLL